MNDTTFDALLAESEWLQRLALAMTRDRGAADDLAQDVLADAVNQRPGYSGAPLRGWLRTVARRRWGRTLEQRGRSKFAERRGARDETVVPVDPREHLGLHRKLAGAIEDMGDPDREIIVRRFLRSEAFDEIAGALGLSEAATRRRLSRAVARLRTRFEGEEPRAGVWLAAIAAGAPPRRTLAAGATGTTAALTLAAKWGAAAALVVAAVLLGRGLVSDPSASGEPRRTAGGSLVDGHGAPPLGESPLAVVGPLESPGPPQRVAAALPVLQVRITDGNGLPPEGLRAYWIDGDSGDRTQLECDSEGFADRPSGGAGVVVALAPGHHALERSAVTASPGAAPLELCLSPSKSTQIKVLTHVSEEVPGAFREIRRGGEVTQVPVTREISTSAAGAAVQIIQRLDVRGRPRAVQRAVVRAWKELGVAAGQVAITGLNGRARVAPWFEDREVIATIEPMGCLYASEPAELVVDTMLPFVTGVRFDPGLGELIIGTGPTGVARGRLVWEGTNDGFDGAVEFAGADTKGEGSGVFHPVFPATDGTFEIPTLEVMAMGETTSYVPVSAARVYVRDGEGMLTSFLVKPRPGKDLGVLEVPRRRRVQLHVRGEDDGPIPSAVATVGGWRGAADGNGVIDAPWFAGRAIGVAAPGHVPSFVTVEGHAFGGRRVAEQPVALAPSTPLALAGLGRAGATSGLQVDIECPGGLMAGPTLEVAGFGRLQPLFRELGLTMDLARIDYPDMRPVRLRLWPQGGEETLRIPGLRTDMPLTVTARDAVGVVLGERTVQLSATSRVDLGLEDVELITVEVDVVDNEGTPLDGGHVVAKVGKESRSFPFTGGRCSISGVSRSRGEVALICHVDIEGKRRKIKGSVIPAALQGPITLRLKR